MSPEEHLHKATVSFDAVEDKNQIDELLDDLERVYEALQPELQEAADDLIGRLHEKRGAL
ncbi:MAG: hypothetical protein OET44_05520 [Gammaproteobacteria bacterium]|nr:hypothetical protein [Gammaproteobacteria bacterium]